MEAHARQKLLEKGTLLGLSGDYNAPSIWGEKHLLSMTLSEYLIVERHDKVLEEHNTNLDVGLIVSREESISISNVDNGGAFLGRKFLLLLRYHDTDWNNQDPNVHVFGLKDDLVLTSPLSKQTWYPQAARLSYAAILCVIEPDKMSEVGTFLVKKCKVI